MFKYITITGCYLTGYVRTRRCTQSSRAYWWFFCFCSGAEAAAEAVVAALCALALSAQLAAL